MLRKGKLYKNKAVRCFAKSKLQSAMEYLMTYGWAILIIAVVLGALFQLGVFNANNFAPKAPPGACQVFRPNGPGTTSFINLEGVCNGELPQYVASFTSNSFIRGSGLPVSGSNWTVFAWIDGSSQGYVYEQNNGPAGNEPACDEFWLGLGGDESRLQTYSSPTPYALFYSAPKPNIWQMITVTGSGGSSGTASLYINGQFIASNSLSTQALTGTDWGWGIGLWSFCSGVAGSYAGLISNVQIYNTSLSASDIQALYQEGIGGAPIDLQNLVAWWPLNGNANDYSGNGYNGQYIQNVNFVSNWWSGYTPP